jgi:hypothetical protein
MKIHESWNAETLPDAVAHAKTPFEPSRAGDSSKPDRLPPSTLFLLRSMHKKRPCEPSPS